MVLLYGFILFYNFLYHKMSVFFIFWAAFCRYFYAVFFVTRLTLFGVFFPKKIFFIHIFCAFFIAAFSRRT